jgi:hypothetical protein
LHAVKQEMAINLADLVFHRTALGDPPGPERTRVVAAARLMGGALGWDERRVAAEVENVMRNAPEPESVLEVVG